MWNAPITIRPDSGPSRRDDVPAPAALRPAPRVRPERSREGRDGAEIHSDGERGDAAVEAGQSLARRDGGGQQRLGTLIDVYA